jgi:GxxExxY protein
LSSTEKEYNELSDRIIGCAIEVHRQLGPGLLESVYELCLYKELTNSGIKVRKQVPVPVFYKEELLDKEFILDLFVKEKIVVEVNHWKRFSLFMKPNW